MTRCDSFAQIGHGGLDMIPNRPHSSASAGRTCAVETMTSLEMLESLAQDARYGLRGLRRAPLFTLASLLTIAIGVGATTSIFSTVNATLLRPLPYNRPTELVDVRTRYIDGRATTGLLSYAELTALRGAQSVGSAGAFATPFDAALIRDDGAPIGIVAAGVTDGFFESLEIQQRLGRTFTADEHRPGTRLPLNVILSSRAWERYFGRDPEIVGKPMRIAELTQGIRVIGVAPAELDLPHGVDVWFNLRLAERDETHFLNTVVRLRSGSSLEQLRAEGPLAMTDAAQAVTTAVGREFVIRSLSVATIGDLRPILLIVLGATFLLLTLACVNVANILMSRGLVRAREFALRAAIGASRGRIVRQLLIESIVLAAMGGIAGLVLAAGLMRLLLILGASKLPRLETIPIDGNVLGYALLVVLFTGVSVGLAPAWQLSRIDSTSVLNAGGRTMTSRVGTSRAMSTLIVAEIALAVAVVCGAGWLTQSFARLRATDLGFTANNRLIVDARPARTFRTGEEAHAWWDQALLRVRDAADGAAVGLSTTFPLRGVSISTANVALAVETVDPTQIRTSRFESVSPGFFHAMGMRLSAGRAFTDADRSDGELVAIVNRSFVRGFFGDGDPIGQTLGFGFPVVDRRAMRRIVGVVEDVRSTSVAEQPQAAMYIPRSQWQRDYTRAPIVVNAANRSLDDLQQRIHGALVQFDPLVIVRFTAAEQVLNDATSRQQLGMTMMLGFGVTALVLAAVGIYGVIACALSQRSTEIATRLAFGATRSQVFWLLMDRGLRLTVMGLVIGLGVANAAGQALASNVFAMRASEPAILIFAGVIVVGVTIVAIAIPSIRASRLNPSTSLRAD